MKCEQYFSIGKSLVNLMSPLIEVVIHCLKTNKIIFIEGSLSKRKIGDPSLLGEDLNSLDQEVYTKLNFDGRLIKSISIPIKNNNVIIGLMCINYDINTFQELNNLTSIFLEKTITKKPHALFKNDWQDKIHHSIHQILQERNLSFDTLTNQNKKELVHKLYDLGAFSERNAADYIANILNISRATIFNYLRIHRKDTHAS